MSGFALGDLLTTVETAAALGVSDQTVLNYVKQGMPCEDGGGGGRPKMFRLDDCKAWIAQHHKLAGSVGRGGRRRGAGRKPRQGSDKDGVVTNAAPDPETNEASAAFAIVGDAAMRKAIVADVKMGMDVPELISRYPASPALVRSIVEYFSAIKLNMDNEERMGRLVSAEDVRARWTQTLATVDQAVESVPAKVAGEIAAVLGLDASGEERVRSIVEGVVAKVRGQIASGV